MFLDLDIVEFQDAAVPYTNIILNAGLVRQVQRIDNGAQDRYLQARQAHQERYEEFRKDATPYEQEDPREKILPPSSVKELPSQGAVIYMVAPHLGTYYTVTPYEEVKAQMLSIGKDTNKEAE